MADNSKQYEAALKSLNALIKKQEALKRATESIKDSWSAVSTEVFKLSGAEWFKKVPKSKEELEKVRNAIKAIKDETDILGQTFAEAITQEDAFKKLQSTSVKSFKSYEKEIKELNKDWNITYEERKRREEELDKQFADKLRAGRKSLSAYSDQQLVSLARTLKAEGKITDAAKQLSEEQRQILASLSDEEGKFNQINSRIRESEAAIQE